jgi:hypothetical protein
MIVKIKKIDRNVNWGAKDQKTGVIKSMFENCKDKLVPGLDKDTGILRTGLTASDEKKFEKALSLEEGTLRKSSPYWGNFSIQIPEDGLTLKTENGTHEVQYTILKSDPEVANSLIELKTNPVAKYVLTSDQAEAKVSNTKRNIVAKAYSIFAKLSPLETTDALFMYGKNPEKMDSEVAQDRLGDLVDKDPVKFIELIGDKNFKEKAWFMKLIKEGIVTKHGKGSGTNQPLYYEDIALGTGLDQAIAFIKAKENQKVALGLKKALAV